MDDLKRVSIVAKIPRVDYLSLKNNGEWGYYNVHFVPRVINYLKFGKRSDALKYCLSEDIDYNSAINLIKDYKYNLNTLIKNNPKLWWTDDYGKYEFSHIQDLNGTNIIKIIKYHKLYIF